MAKEWHIKQEIQAQIITKYQHKQQSVLLMQSLVWTTTYLNQFWSTFMSMPIREGMCVRERERERERGKWITFLTLFSESSFNQSPEVSRNAAKGSSLSCRKNYSVCSSLRRCQARARWASNNLISNQRNGNQNKVN